MNLQEKNANLLQLAREQGGFFTAAQAEKLGFDNANQHRFVGDGRWERVRRGIFRIANEPRGDHSDLQSLALFFRHRDGSSSGVFGLDSAAAIHQMGDVMPLRNIVLVTHDFKKRAKIPDNVELVRVANITKEIVRINGLAVTSPIRTVVDLLEAPDRDPEETRRAFVAARRDGVISKTALAELEEWARPETWERIICWESETMEKKSR